MEDGESRQTNSLMLTGPKNKMMLAVYHQMMEALELMLYWVLESELGLSVLPRCNSLLFCCSLKSSYRCSLSPVHMCVLVLVLGVFCSSSLCIGITHSPCSILIRRISSMRRLSSMFCELTAIDTGALSTVLRVVAKVKISGIVAGSRSWVRVHVLSDTI